MDINTSPQKPSKQLEALSFVVLCKNCRRSGKKKYPFKIIGKQILGISVTFCSERCYNIYNIKE